MDARSFRKQLLRVIWSGARQLGDNFDPRIFAPERVSGLPGETFSQLTLEELIGVAYKIKKAGARIWVPAPPRGLNLRQATPVQFQAIQDHLARQVYLQDPEAFFKKRLGVLNPSAPTFSEAQRILAFLASKERSYQCAQLA
jgi:hypothetical protein